MQSMFSYRKAAVERAMKVQEVMPKARFAIQPGTVTVQFHDPIEPADFGDRDCLMAKVRDVISGGLPQELRTVSKRVADNLLKS